MSHFFFISGIGIIPIRKPSSHSPILGDIQADETVQILYFGRQLLQLVVIEPELLQRRQIAQVAGQVLNLVIAQVQALQFRQAADRLGQRLQQVLSQLQRFQLCQTGGEKENQEDLVAVKLWKMQKAKLTIRNLKAVRSATYHLTLILSSSSAAKSRPAGAESDSS